MARTALVTGANRGIGFEIARKLSLADLRVLAGVRSLDAAEAADAKFKQAGLSDISAVVVDVSELSAIPQRLSAIEAEHGPIDVVVNNAAILIDAPGGFAASLFEMTDETFRLTWQTNTAAPAAIMRTLIPGMMKRGFGRVVNVSSTAGQLAGMGAGYPAYRVSKTALNALTRIAAAEAGNGNVKINACCPGWVRTDMGGQRAERSPSEGAETPVWLALLPDDGPTGGFFKDKKPIAF